MHHLSTELFSISDSMLIPIFKHQIPIHPWISVFHPKYHHWTAFIGTAIDQHVQLTWSQVYIWGPLRYQDGISLQAQLYPQVETILTVNLIKDSTWAVPHHGCCSSAYTHGTHCGFPAFIEWYQHLSYHSYWPLFPPHLQPKDHFIWERTSW